MDEASQAAEAAIAKQDDEFLARWVRANIRLDRGDLAGADTEFRWFVRTYSARDSANKPIKDADTLLLVAQAGAVNARWHNLSDQFRFILNEVLQRRAQGRRRLVAGRVTGRRTAAGEVQPPRGAHVVRQGALHQSASRPRTGRQRPGRSARIRTRRAPSSSPSRRWRSIRDCRAALHLLADVHFISGESDADAEATRASHARSIRTTRRRSAGSRPAYSSPSKRANSTRSARHAEKQTRSRADSTLNWPTARRPPSLQRSARSSIRKAVDAWPHLGEAKTSLGLLAMRLGQEDEAREGADRGLRGRPIQRPRRQLAQGAAST